MITLHTDGPCQVGSCGNTFYLTNAGTWTFPAVDWVQARTNAAVTNEAYWSSQGTLVVDQLGNIAVTRGANVPFAAYSGLLLAFATVGVALILRFIVRWTLGVSGVPRTGTE